MDLPLEQVARKENEHSRPPLGDIRMIMGETASFDSSRKAQMVQNVQPTGFIPKLARIDNPIIGFIEEDA